MSAVGQAEHAVEVGFFLAAAFINRRLYADDSALTRQNLERLGTELETYLSRESCVEFTLGVLKSGVSLSGRTLLEPPEGVSKLAEHMRQRGFEFLSIERGVTAAELETLLALLNLDAADLAGIDTTQWLQARGARHVAMRHFELADGTVVRSMRELYANGKDTMGQEFARVMKGGLVEMGAMAELASTMLELVMHSDVPIASMVALRERDDHAFVHSMNVSLLASSQAATLGLDEETIRQISVAGLVHDLGKTAIDPAIVNKDGPLTIAEHQTLATHGGEGARMLLRTHGGAGLEAVVAAEHHMLYTEQPHLASQLVAIADTFDCIRTLHPFSDRETLRSALHFMLDQTKQRLNPYLLQRFCLMCGMYMPGDEVALTTGEHARVVQTNVELGHKPVLEVTNVGSGTAKPGTVVDLATGVQTAIAVTRSATLSTLNMQTVDALG